VISSNKLLLLLLCISDAITTCDRHHIVWGEEVYWIQLLPVITGIQSALQPPSRTTRVTRDVPLSQEACSESHDCNQCAAAPID
jgi:hypothetical protein